MIELVRAGRTPGELGRQFECSARAIRNRVRQADRDAGVRVGHNRVARLMRTGGLQGVSRRKRAHTTVRREDRRPAPDLVARNFTASAPDQLWVADITYISTWAGFLYLAVVIDAYARRVVG